MKIQLQVRVQNTATTSLCVILLLLLPQGHVLSANTNTNTKDSSSDSASTSTSASAPALNFNYGRNLNLNQSNETLSYQIAALLAQEDAKCLEEFGGRENKTVVDFYAEISNPFSCSAAGASPGGAARCETCRSLTQSLRRSSEDCSAFCGPNSFCYKRCEAIRGRGNETTATAQKERADNSELYFLEEPRVFCEDVIALEEQEAANTNNEFATLFRGNEGDAYSPFAHSSSSSSGEGAHSIFLKWKLLSKKDSSTEIPFPVVYLLEYQSPDSELWILLGKRFSTVERVTVPYHSQQLRWRLTAVGPDGILARIHSVQFYQTLDGFKEPGPPSRIYVAKEIVSEASVDVVIGWEPPPEKPCAYKINLYPVDTMEHHRTHRLTEPLVVNLHLIKGLKFGSKYDVTMTSRGDNWHFESTLKSQNFTTITCLEAHNHRFDKCDPLPPRNISHQLVSIPDTTPAARDDEDKKGKLNVRLSWLPPLYASSTNPISSYSISLGPPLNETQAGNHKNILTAAFFRMNRNHNVAGNTTHIYLNELLQNTQYVIKVIAVSVKGKSQPVQYHLSTKLAGKEEIMMPQSSNWLYLSISISCVILILFGCHFTRILMQKRKVKKARNQYFQTMEDRDVISADWSIVPLNEESYGLKMLGEFSKEKWEISYDKLVLGDVIGQGAFGVVRRASMARKHFLALSKKRDEAPNLDPEELQTVAVKMLKVSATRDDRDQLIKEILTMQNLGSHAQIVSLLGACTKGRSLCLVMEFCPGGDLLTFLRKVRAKYWPTLGMVESSRNTATAENSRSVPHSHAPCSTRTSVSSHSHRKSTDSSPITYADVEVLSELSSSLSPEGTLHEYGNAPPAEPSHHPEPPGVDFEDECRPIDEKDVLCYARQIAMGMEYLEKNRIIHRDLACRNVLLLGDYKQVKLSDFGLSRDVYTWNVYHQKSNGKLPIKWMSIESIFTHVFTSKSDVWSYGILLWELVTLGGTPYPGLGNTELFQVLKSGYRMERPDNCSEELYALMKKCWRTAPASRPNFTELRRYVETMMEAAEPSLYLSLMADLPSDYFHINRDDLLLQRLDEETTTTTSGSRENVSLMSASNSCSNLKSSSRIQHYSSSKRPPARHSHHHDSAHKRSSTTLASALSNNNEDEEAKIGSKDQSGAPAPIPCSKSAESFVNKLNYHNGHCKQKDSSGGTIDSSKTQLSAVMAAKEKETATYGHVNGKSSCLAASDNNCRKLEQDIDDEEEDEVEVRRSLIRSSGSESGSCDRNMKRSPSRDNSCSVSNETLKHSNNNNNRKHCNGFSRPNSAAAGTGANKEINNVTIIENRVYDLI